MILELTWNTGRLVREYTLLIDPPTGTHQRSGCAAPDHAAGRRRGRRRRARGTPAGAAGALARVAPEPCPRAAQAYANLRRGLRQPLRRRLQKSSLATRRPRSRSRPSPRRVARPDAGGAVPRQPDAFVGNNMNRLKAGGAQRSGRRGGQVDLSPPRRASSSRLQSADFAAYRERLASGVAPIEAAAPSRQASGTVQAAVETASTGGGDARQADAEQGGASASIGAGRQAVQKREARMRPRAPPN